MASNSYHLRRQRWGIAHADWMTEEQKAEYFLVVEYWQYCGTAQREHRSYLKSFDKWIHLVKGIVDIEAYISERASLYRFLKVVNVTG